MGGGRAPTANVLGGSADQDHKPLSVPCLTAKQGVMPGQTARFCTSTMLVIVTFTARAVASVLPECQGLRNKSWLVETSSPPLTRPPLKACSKPKTSLLCDVSISSTGILAGDIKL